MKSFFDDASFQPGIVMWEVGKIIKEDFNSSPEIPIRFYGRDFSNANGVTVKFNTPYDNPIDVGDIVFDSRNEEYYICTESFNINDIHWQGRFTLCNWILRWQNKDGKVLEYPCYDVNSTQYNSGEQSNRQFTIGSSQHMITLPCDENTIMLSSPQRFILDKNKQKPTVFVVTQNDNTSYGYGKKGLVRITLYENVFNPETDNVDIGICDYVDITKGNCDHNIIRVSATIDYKTDIIKSGGNSQLFTGKFTDENGEEINISSCRWSVICDFFDSLQIEENGCQLKIGIDDDNYIDEEFKIVFSDSDNRYSDSLIIKVGSLL